MDVAIVLVTSRADGIRGVREIEEVEATEAVDIPGTDTDGDTISNLLVHDDVVGAANRQIIEVTGQVLVVAEGLGSVLGVDIQQLR